MKRLFLYFIAIITCLLTSCDRILDVPLPENQLSTSLVFENNQTAEAALANLYANLRDNSPLAANSAGSLLGIYTDDLNFFNTNLSANMGIYQLQILPSNSAIYTYWSSAYKIIYDANAIIEGVYTSPTLSVETQNRVAAEAMTIRTLIFYYLQQVYGDIPMPTSTNYTINQNLSKTNATTVLNLLIDDIDASIPKLQDSYRNNERIFINKKTAELLKAKILLNLNRPDEAEILLKQIATNALYSFQNDITKVFIKSGTHILWQLKPKNAGDATKEASTYYFTGVAPTNMALTSSLISAFSNNDLRKSNWMATVTVGSSTWYRADKYKNRSNNTTEYSIIFRLEEVYLLLAESLAKQNKISEALPYINAIRTRANIDSLTSSITQQNLLQEIISENRREFFTEMGHRFLDLKRNNALQQIQITKTNWQPYNALWPIPEKDLLLNPNLNPQNNGY